MNDKIPPDEKKLLLLLPMLAKWIRTNRNLSDSELAAFIRQYPDHYDYVNRTPLSNMIQTASKYKGHQIYGKDIETIISPEGRKWLANCLERVKDHYAKLAAKK